MLSLYLACSNSRPRLWSSWRSSPRRYSLTFYCHLSLVSFPLVTKIMVDATEIQLETKQTPSGRSHPASAGLTDKLDNVVDDAIPDRYRLGLGVWTTQISTSLELYYWLALCNRVPYVSCKCMLHGRYDHARTHYHQQQRLRTPSPAWNSAHDRCHQFRDHLQYIPRWQTASHRGSGGHCPHLRAFRRCSPALGSVTSWGLTRSTAGVHQFGQLAQRRTLRVGLTTPVSIWVGYECNVHMAEGIHDASRNLPKSILSAVSVNGCLGFLMAMTLIFCVGDAEAALAEADGYNGYAFLGIFMNNVGNRYAVNMLVFLVIFGLTNCAISETAVTSRQIWSFARDSGLPFSGWLSHISPGQNIPLRAVLVSITITALLSLMNIGSGVALNAINSLAGVSVLSSYLISIACLVWRRIHGAPLPPRQWSLGRLGLPINIAALCCAAPLWFFAL